MTVRAGLTRKRVREIPDYAAFVRRSIRAHGRRCGDADPEDLAGLLELREVVEGSDSRGCGWSAAWRLFVG